MAMKIPALVLLLVCAQFLDAQNKSAAYNSCLLKDSIDKHLETIRLSPARVFTDSAQCKRELLDSIANKFLTTSDKKYLGVLTSIAQNSKSKIEGEFQDVMKMLVDGSFSKLLDAFYTGRGGYAALEKEVVLLMNTIVGGRPYKQQYLGLLNVEIEKAKDKDDRNKELYLVRFKQRIEDDKFH